MVSRVALFRVSRSGQLTVRKKRIRVLIVGREHE